jgi:hypothetical protein
MTCNTENEDVIYIVTNHCLGRSIDYCLGSMILLMSKQQHFVFEYVLYITNSTPPLLSMHVICSVLYLVISR